MIITYAMRVNRGERQYSEDSVRAVRVGSEWLFVLADGLGGMGHGEIASETAVESAINRFQWEYGFRLRKAHEKKTAKSGPGSVTSLSARDGICQSFLWLCISGLRRAG